MCAPEDLETLITILVRSRVPEQRKAQSTRRKGQPDLHNGHHKKHEMIGNSTSLRIVNLKRELRAEFCRNVDISEFK